MKSKLAKISKSNWFLWLTLVLVAPLGIFLLWKYKNWNKLLKIAISIASILLMALIVVNSMSGSPVIQVDGVKSGIINTTNSVYTLKGKVLYADNSTKVTVNNKKVELTNKEFSIDLTLQEGENLVVIIAENSKGKDEDRFTIIFSKPVEQTNNNQNDSAPTEQKNPEISASNQPPAQTAQPTQTKVQRAKEIIKDIPDAFIAYPNDKTFATVPPDDYTGSFSIIIADGIPDACSDAKRRSYDLYKQIYTDALLKGSVERVKIVHMGYLSSSLGKTDGEGLTNSNSWSGESNFFKILFQTSEGEKDLPDAEATWVVGINGCK